MKEGKKIKEGSFFSRHPVMINAIIIFLIGILGIAIVFFSLNIFTRHGEYATVPKVEDISYTDAIKLLHEKGFRTDIRDSIYNEDIKPGYVVEQFPRPGSKVKPGRKIFLYINAVHPREVLIDADSYQSGGALEGYSLRQGLARLEELGFRNIKVVTKPGTSDRIIQLMTNGQTIRKMQKVPVNAQIIVEVYDGQLRSVQDSILEEEYLQYMKEEGYPYAEYENGDGYYLLDNGEDTQETEPVAPAENDEPAYLLEE